MVAAWSRRWGRECFCKSLRPEGGKLLQISRGRGPYLLQIDIKIASSARQARDFAELARTSLARTSLGWEAPGLLSPFGLDQPLALGRASL